MELLNVAVTNLGKYNEGELVFEWLKLPATYEEIERCFSQIGLNDVYEEYFITDYESDVGLKCYEYSNLEYLNEKIEELEDATKGDYDKLEAVIERDYTGSNFEELIETMQSDEVDFYKGWTAEEYEKDFIEECYDLSFMKDGWLSQYISIDYEAMADENPELYETSNGVLVDRRN